MTDKTLLNKAEIPVNNPTTHTSTADATRNSGPRSRVLPQADALKERFKAGSIPLQTDFADLIDLANIGRQAMGGAEGQTGPANGFTLSSMGRLELKPNTNKGISVDNDGVAIKLKAISGLTMDKDGVTVKPKANSGIELKDSEGISIKPGNGISVDEGGIAVKAEENKGLQVSNNGVSVKVGKGMRVSNTGMIEPDVTSYSFGTVEEGVEYATVKVNTSTNGLVVDLYKGLINTANGLSVNVGDGLQADPDKGVSLIPEQTFQKGMIIMFSGTSIPLGWALCDGTGGTPNLSGRFILGGTLDEVNSKNNVTLTGSKNDISFNKNISVTVNSHQLSINEIPSHTHGIEHALYSSEEGNGAWGESWRIRSGSTTASGGGEGHSHTASASADIMPPYYILAFIMKK